MGRGIVGQDYVVGATRYDLTAFDDDGAKGASALLDIVYGQAYCLAHEVLRSHGIVGGVWVVGWVRTYLTNILRPSRM